MSWESDADRRMAEYRGESEYDDDYHVIPCRVCGRRTSVSVDVISAGCVRHASAPIVRRAPEAPETEA